MHFNTVKERIAGTFIHPTPSAPAEADAQTGNIILAGDAAHVHSVNGGQGLNTGLADAFSIAWRLATVLKQPSISPKAINSILGSYDIERRKTAQGVIDVAAVLVRDTVHTAKQYVATIEKNAGYITGKPASYGSMDFGPVPKFKQDVLMNVCFPRHGCFIRWTRFAFGERV